jgi:hypothetical protein
MSVLEEYFNKILKIAYCCNRGDDNIPDTQDTADENRRGIIPCKKHKMNYVILSNIDSNKIPHSNNIDIDDNINKIKKELEDNMSFKHESNIYKSPRIPVLYDTEVS